MMMDSHAMASAVSVPGRTRRCTSARVASQFTRGSTLMSFAPRFMRSMTAWPQRPSPFDASAILPHMTMTSGTRYTGLS